MNEFAKKVESNTTLAGMLELATLSDAVVLKNNYVEILISSQYLSDQIRPHFGIKLSVEN